MMIVSLIVTSLARIFLKFLAILVVLTTRIICHQEFVLILCLQSLTFLVRSLLAIVFHSQFYTALYRVREALEALLDFLSRIP